MTPIQIIALAVAGMAVLGMVAVFTIAWRREAGRPSPPLDREARRRDRSEDMPAMVSIPVREREEEEPEPAPRIEEAPPAHEETEAVEPMAVTRVEEVPPEEAGVTRRQFFNRAILAAFGTYLALVGAAMLAFFWPRLAGGFGAPIDAGDVDDLRSRIRQPDGSVTPAYVPEARAYIVPFAEGEIEGTDFEGLPVIGAGLSALWQRCVHLGCRVPWCQPSQGFECPCHGSRYNLHGEYESGPAPRNLDRFRVEVTDANRLIVHTADILETPRAQEKTVAYPQGPSCITIGG